MTRYTLVVKVKNPNLCKRCPFRQAIDPDDEIMIRIQTNRLMNRYAACTRKDCDNWSSQSEELIQV